MDGANTSGTYQINGLEPLFALKTIPSASCSQRWFLSQMHEAERAKKIDPNDLPISPFAQGRLPEASSRRRALARATRSCKTAKGVPPFATRSGGGAVSPRDCDKKA